MNLNLTFVGDIFPANMEYNIGFGVANQFVYQDSEVWLNIIKQYFSKADFSLGNLESPLIDKEKNPQNKAYAGSKNFASFLEKTGIKMVSIANNHILEQGIEGVLSTKKALKKNNIQYVGELHDGTSNIATFEYNGIIIGIAGFNDIHNIENKDIYAEYSDQNVIKALNIMSSLKVDYKIVTFHWGDEYVHIPSRKQIEAAHKFIEYGADIIVGHHPHVIQPIERYKKGLIFYSLGNFIFDMIWSDYVRLGMVANVTLEKGKKIKCNIIPIYIGNDYIPRKVNNFRWCQKLVRRTEKKMFSFYSLSDSYLSDLEYDKNYNRDVKINSIYQRVMMKIFIIKHWKKISYRSKRMLISNILLKLRRWIL
ncbi:MAG: CapA family protein [Candidatus Helarchaeota archaeon]